MRRPARYALLVAAAHAQTSVAPTGQPAPCIVAAGGCRRPVRQRRRRPRRRCRRSRRRCRCQYLRMYRNGPDDRAFLGAVVGMTAAPSWPTIKGADARRRRGRVVRLPGQRIAPGGGRTRGCFSPRPRPACYVWARAPAAACGLRGGGGDSKIADAGPAASLAVGHRPGEPR